MNDLLDFVLDAHGGLKRWSGADTLTVKLPTPPLLIWHHAGPAGA
jgi:hypothetical protein